MTIYAITTDNAVESEKSESNSLREVLLFCAVLVVEVYSLAVAFGGPFFEVGYFLLVVISQTTAGAYIWAQLRRTDKSLPLPELLAMGFAIGSASAAISQLIIRDLLGIRLFLSPLVPIIGVAIWLVAKHNPRLPVTITHANTNTLLWLLFPAPLAMSFFIWELHAIFVLPLLALSFISKYFRKYNYLPLLVMVSSLLVIFNMVLYFTHKTSVALSLSGWDELFDEAMAIGFSNWGIGDHIGRAGDTIAYYKLSHIWLGPILELCNATPMIISTSVVPLIIFAFVGLALWALTQNIYRSSSAAGVASVLVFLQHTLPEPENFAFRIAQCLVLVYLLAGIIALIRPWSQRFIELLVTACVFFTVFAARAQYGLILLFGFSIHKSTLAIRKRIAFNHYMTLMLTVAVTLVICYLIFFNEPAHATGSPNQGSTLQLFALFISLVAVRSLIPMLTSRQKINSRAGLLLFVICSSTVIFFLIPQSNLSNAPSLTIALMVSVLISNEVICLRKSLTKFEIFVALSSASALGFLLRLFWDLYKWTDYAGAGTYLKPFVTMVFYPKFVGNFSILPFIFLLLLIFIWLKIQHKALKPKSIVLLASLSMSLGISVATTYRSVTNHYRYGMDLASNIEPNSPMAWFVDADRLEALAWIKNNTARDDIFAQNTSLPDFMDTAYSASLIISNSTHRRAYIESVQSTEVQKDFPRHVSHQTERQRKELLRLNTSFRFPITPSNYDLANMRKENVKWFVVDLANTELRDWEPWATTRFMNEKVAILELAQLPVPSN